MAFPTASISSFPVNIPRLEQKEEKELTIHSIRDSKFSVAPVFQDEELIQKSLRLPNDPRFVEIKHYTNSGNEGHFARLMEGRRLSAGPVDARSSSDLTFTDAANVVLQNEPSLQSQRLKCKQFELSERAGWQQCFDSSVSRLMIDFDLSHDAQCRLNHLDRMHAWYEEHGGKQQRKAEKAPNYLTADRTGKMPAGSTANVSTNLSGTSLLLAGAFALRGNRSPNGSVSAR